MPLIGAEAVAASALVCFASAIIAADSAKTSLSRRTCSARSGVSGDCEKPIAVWVSADSYVEQSTDSVIVIVSTTSQAPRSRSAVGSRASPAATRSSS